MVGRRAVITMALGSTLGLLTISSGNAATLGGLRSSSMTAINVPVSITPPTTTPPTTTGPALLPCTVSNLPASFGTALAGWTTGCGSTAWAVHSGDWVVGPDGLASTKGRGVATFDAGQQNLSIQALISEVGTPNAAAGVVLDHDPANGAYLMALLDGRDSIVLQLVAGGATTNLAGVSGTIASPSTVLLSRTGSTVTVAVNGVAVISYSLTPTDLGTLGSGNGVGVHWSKDKDVRFTSIVVTAT